MTGAVAPGSESDRDSPAAPSTPTPTAPRAEPAQKRWRAPGVLRSLEVVERDESTGAVWLREPHAFQFTGRVALARMLSAFAPAQAVEQSLWDALDWPSSGC